MASEARVCVPSDPSFCLARRSSLLRVVSDLLEGQLKRSRGATNVHRWQWTENTALDDRGLSLDSIEVMEAAGAVNRFFHLYETGIEDYLLARRTLGEWVSLVEKAWLEGPFPITFTTSGSTGKPKACTHSFVMLSQEVEALAELVRGGLRIVALAPAHHIYGFLFTVLLPERLHVPVLYPAGGVLDTMRHLEPGDVVVSFPARWEYIEQSMEAFPSDVVGVTSTAPCDPDLIARLKVKGLQRMVEVYGSTETGGVGWRDDPSEPYHLFPYWSPAQNASTEVLVRTHPEHGTRSFELMDHVTWVGREHFRPLGRRDRAVQVAGTNVFPHRIRQRLEQHPLVEAAAVRPMRPEEGNRLKAFVVPADDAINHDELRARLHDWMRAQLDPPERPYALTFGKSLPRDDMGKLTDW